MIRINSIEKSYKHITVLRGINMCFSEGRTTALLGPNGSGKTTLIKIILGLVHQDAGTVLVHGNDIAMQSAYRADIGYMPQIARYPENLRVDELLNMIADVRNATPRRKEELMDVFDLHPHRAKSMRSLSGGTRQKVSAVAALMFDTPILILDEPTAGLDPLMARRLKDVVLREKEKGRTIILTTHILSEIEELSDDITCILEGCVTFHGSRHELLSSTGCINVEHALASLQPSPQRRAA